MTDTLALVQRLRRLEADQARRALAEALRAERDAESAVAALAATLLQETAYAKHNPSRDFGDWLPAEKTARQEAAAKLLQAATAVAECRQTLAQARAGERAVKHVRETHAAKSSKLARRHE